MSTAAKRLLNLEQLAARVMTVGEFLAFVRVIFRCADLTVTNLADCARFKAVVIEALARELKLDQDDLRAALLGRGD